MSCPRARDVRGRRRQGGRARRDAGLRAARDAPNGVRRGSRHDGPGIGAPPGRAYEVMGWELWAPALPYYSSGDYEKAIEVMSPIVAEHPEYPAAALQPGLPREPGGTQGRRDRAPADRRRALAAVPGVREARLRLRPDPRGAGVSRNWWDNHARLLARSRLSCRRAVVARPARARKAGTGSGSGRATSSTAPCSSPARASTRAAARPRARTPCAPGRRRTGRAPPARRRPASTSPWVTCPIETSATKRRAVRARDADRERVRAGQRRAAVGCGEPRRRGRGQRCRQPALGEAAHPVAERAGREAAPRRRRRGRARAASASAASQIARERQVAERAGAVPALVARLGDDPLGRARRVEAVERLQPVDRARARGSACRAAPRRRSGRRASAASASEKPRAREPRLEPASVRRENRQRLERLPAGVDRLGDRDDRPCRLGLGLGPDERLARVAALAQPRVERHLAEQRHADLAPRARSPPPVPKTSEVMFSTTPIRRMFVFCAIVAARDATSCASGCGVVTITASARGSSWPSEIETSPVPGGMSTSEQVELAPVHVGEELLERAVQHRPAPHHGRVVVEEEADRHQLQVVRAPAGRSSCRRRPAAARRRACAGSSGRRCRRRARRRAGRAAESAAARFTVSDDLPTPPLPLAIASTRVARSTRDPLRALGDAAAELRRQRGLLVGRHHVEAEPHRLDAGHGPDVLAHLLLEARRGAGSRRR